jgi:hypothetical protein
VRIVGTDDVEVERALRGGRLECGCGGALRPWGSARERAIRLAGGIETRRRPRRSICSSCGQTHVLLPADSLGRRRDAVAVIGAALSARAAGLSMAKAAARVVGVPAATVRGWLRRFAVVAGAVRARFTVLAHDLDPLLGPIAARGEAFADAVEAIGVAARAAVLRFGPGDAWQFASSATGGWLLANTSCP